MAEVATVAEFFANKKKKKKTFKKFNANLIDANTITKRVHVDAPALSKDQDHHSGEFNSSDNEDEQATPTPAPAPAAAPAAAALSSVPTGPDNIAQKLRVQETKAALAAAREGMERKARENEEIKKKKEQAAAATVAPRFAAAAATGGKWVPPHLRAAGRAVAGTTSSSNKFDVANEELFPDLASADKILEQKEAASAPKFKAPKKKPISGATWATKKPAVAAAAPAKKAEPVKEVPKEKAPEPAPAPVAAPADPVKKVPVKKKKKKDLSTFKPGSS